MNAARIRSAGFTLVEVLIALIIMSVGMLGIAVLLVLFLIEVPVSFAMAIVGIVGGIYGIGGGIRDADQHAGNAAHLLDRPEHRQQIQSVDIRQRDIEDHQRRLHRVDHLHAARRQAGA